MKPLKFPGSTHIISIMQACRVCLATNMKLFHMMENNFRYLYEQLTGMLVEVEDQLPLYVCWECAQRLINCCIFKNKALQSHTFLMDFIHKYHFLTIKSLERIDRKRFSTTLIYKAFETNHYDLAIDSTLEKPLETVKDVNIDTELNIKEEIENECCERSNDFEADSTASSDIVLSKHKERKKIKKKNKEAPKIDRRRKAAADVLNKDIFTITDLSVDEQKMEVQRRKETLNFKRCGFQCTICFKGFLDGAAYNGHMIRHTNQSGSHECEICKVRFKTPHALRNHFNAHMQRFSCKRCPYVTTRRHAAKLHENYHNGTRYQCPHCQEDFGKFSTYMSHLRIKHPSQFVCALCGYSFVSPKGLVQHKKLKHRFDEVIIPQDGPYCERCDVRFVSQDALERHVKLSAEHNEDIDSIDNAKRRAREESEAEHKRRERNKEAVKKNRSSYRPEGPIPCEQCDTQLPDSLSYYRHFRRAHPDKNRTTFPSKKTRCMCEVCGKMFQSLALLQDHSFTHTDSKQFKCSQCGKTFQRKYRLIAHRRLHGEERPRHACAVCGKFFSSTSNMQRHMVSHTGLKPFKCEMCGKCFKHASEKRVHITYVHLKKPWPKRSRGKRRSEGRQSQPATQPMSELDIVQPLWPACNDPKIINITDDKPMYYNLKI